MRMLKKLGLVAGIVAVGVCTPSAALADSEESCLDEFRYYAEYPVTGGDPTFVNQPVYTVIYYNAYTQGFVFCVAG